MADNGEGEGAAGGDVEGAAGDSLQFDAGEGAAAESGSVLVQRAGHACPPAALPLCDEQAALKLEWLTKMLYKTMGSARP